MNLIYEILFELGIGRRYLGSHYLAYAIHATLQDESYLQNVTKRLYPETAAHFGTTWTRVERNMRTVIDTAWRQNRPRLEELARRTLLQSPQITDFIDIIATHLLRRQGDGPAD